MIGLASSWEGRNCPRLEHYRSRYWVSKDHGTVVETLPGDLMQLLDTAEISGILDRPQLNGLSAAIQCFGDNTPLQSGDI